MEDPRWLRLITIGLVLAALAVGYFLLTGRLVSNSATRTEPSLGKVTPSATPGITLSSPAVTPKPTASPTSMSAYSRIAGRTNGGKQPAQTLPNTGFPIGLAVVFSISGIISGWGLCRFPH